MQKLIQTTLQKLSDPMVDDSLMKFADLRCKEQEEEDDQSAPIMTYPFVTMTHVSLLEKLNPERLAWNGMALFPRSINDLIDMIVS